MQNQVLSLCAADIMQRNLVRVAAGDTLPEAERKLTEAQVTGAPVIDDTGRVIGVLSIRDISRHRLEDAELPADATVEVFDDETDETEQITFRRPESGACAADVMTPDVVSVTSSTAIPQIARKMLDAHVHRVLVIERGRLLGLISTMDLLGVFASLR